ncbi:hypothetical protein [Candidatus Nitrosotenuis uzonensis]|uniref:Uncharacterized protein n=1 Tax=Candidatus Nitrosotenuis uzonensis TaxID=1407055 RepID=V6ATM5_9ARCH|nr:hypothetical protein [Candidatus Nitrosotenuis uzonensis]CDI05934.1 conserved hypothetical protein [Candidatus Nitrosotenuis uzonensis]
MDHITDEDRRRIELLEIVSKNGLRALNLSELTQLRVLVEKKDYSYNKKAHKSKAKLLAKINAAIFDLEER